MNEKRAGLRREMKVILAHFLVYFPDPESEIETLLEEVLEDFEKELEAREMGVIHQYVYLKVAKFGRTSIGI